MARKAAKMGAGEIVAVLLGIVIVAVLGYAGASALIDQRAAEAGEDSAKGFLGGIGEAFGEFFGKGEDGEGLGANLAEFFGKGADGKGFAANVGAFFKGNG